MQSPFKLPVAKQFGAIFFLFIITIITACDKAVEGESKDKISSSLSKEKTRNQYEFSTEESFDSESIAPYSGQHTAIYKHIDQSIEQHTAALQRWMRQPSISAQNIGIQEMAEMLRDDLTNLGFQESNLVKTDGHPGVWGYYDAGAEETLLVYMMYDVQPVNENDWQSPPFEANIIENDLGQVMMARGSVNQKGPQRAFLNALESIIAVEGKLPINIMIAAEGEEELGSPHYPQIVDAYEDRMKTAKGVIFPMISQSPDGSSRMLLGVKGILYFELESQGGEWGGPAKAEIHGSYKGLVDSPTIRLVQAIASMTDKTGNTILIDGYYDDIRPPTQEEQRLINKAVSMGDDQALQKSLDVSQWIDGQTGRAATVDLLYNPTLNINGIWSGYIEEGVKTVLPHLATAKMDSRLPLGQDPDVMLQKVRKHLDKHGFDDIKIRKLSGYPGAQTSVESDLSQAVLSVYNKYANGVSVIPRIGGSAPFYQFTERLNLPLIPTGLGYGTGVHAPNEFLLIKPNDQTKAAGLAEIEKAYVDIIFALANK
ncbi:M20/M25/M40 family metallo-hydrolase [Aliikangiella marina]|uniref:M20/M25/M40 family metallo-hydrolase n=1 Tax=Aliikangiella marina TaxID=1712262 RepID=A0A545T4R4_9GAMM|nr:M20/M25/M40 family metallo-hydrolase [Aliikangiella marina]TQV72175.1 M20/M25/M40 family metallo-hydrolase [Aliikangiella marina]